MAERRLQAGNNGLFSISSRGPKVDLDLAQNERSKFHVVEKDMPANLPTQYKGVTINWFACFGVRHRMADGSAGDFADVEYLIHLDQMPGKTFLAFYDGAIHELSGETSGGKTHVRLNRGDPPVGSVPP